MMIPLAIAEEGVTGRRSKPAFAVRAVLQSPWNRGSRLHTADGLEGRRLEASEVPDNKDIRGCSILLVQESV